MPITFADAPLGLYIHIPWCVKKCPYCDFNSHQAQTLPQVEYVAALLADAKNDAHLSHGREISSIFFGGGTPSLFNARSIHEILEGVNDIWGFAKNIEITLEANPGATEYSNLKGLRRAGVNRLSIGVQSFDLKHLKKLGRIHSGDEAIAAYHAARQAGFDNINLDLMHGLPAQTEEEAFSDLSQAIALAPEHISWYQLTIEPNTVFHKQQPALPTDDTLVAMSDYGVTQLSNAGFQQYEISAYSQPGKRAKHNVNYWQFGDYLALGAGAHGKLTGKSGEIRRYQKTRLPADYLNPQKPFTCAQECTPKNQQMLEFLMNALRLNHGVPRHFLEQRTQLKDSELEPVLAPLQARGLIAEAADTIRTTPLGLRFLNSLLAEIQP